MLIFITFCIVIILQIFFYLFLFSKFIFAKPLRKKNIKHPVSVIICAKNEANNLEENLPLIANQNYPILEIVLVNDASTDGTVQVMEQFKSNHGTEKLSIQIISIIDKVSKGKKAALNKGIKAATNPYLILTDADCKPAGKNWIDELSAHFSNKKKIVLGYGAYQKISNSFLNKIIRFETLLTAVQYFSYAKIGMAYMGVGRNMAYKKELYNHNNGFEKHGHLISGDDDLLINEISNKYNTDICYSEKSFTISKPPTSFTSWIKQKSRHFTTANHYKSIHKVSLALFYLSQFFFWFLAITLLAWHIYPGITSLLIFIRFLIWYFTIAKSAKLLNEKDLIIFAPLFEISLIFIQLTIFIRNIISPPKHW